MSRKIFITESDKDKLLKIINKAQHEDFSDNVNLKDLEAEITRANLTSIDELPNNVITMNSTAILLIEGDEEEYTLVYPSEADISKNKISVLSPIGTAILGYSEGDIVKWEVPKGTVDINIKKVLFQPEASGNYDL